MTDDALTCPYCCSKNVFAEFVDIGVGMQQATPYHCFDCDARQMSPYDDYTDATPEEQSLGWLRGQEYP